VADAEGPEAISMRRIAREVGAGAMSLYWYVSSKEELLDLMLDAIEAEIEVPDPSGDWRADLHAFAHRTREALRRHEWAVEFIGTRPPSGPNDVRNLERLLSLLDGLGVEDVRLIMGAFMTVATFVIGAVIREAQEVRFQHEQERREAALTAEEIQAEHERYRAWFEASGEFPHIAKLMKSGVDPDSPDTREERFQFSLDCVLDGIAARLAAAGARPVPPG
jgi:AcrR family transcriptional regulator